MATSAWRKFEDLLKKRSPRERVILFGAVLAVTIYGWAMLFFSPSLQANSNLDLRIASTQNLIRTQRSRIDELNAWSRDDPDSAGRVRQRELQQAIIVSDQRLEELYSQLINPQQMSRMLTEILQRETALTLVSLENLGPDLLHTSGLMRDSANPGGAPENIELFKHGLHMVFEGSFMETVRFLRSLEQLANNFYWENLELRIQEYPKARISLDIYTLSTQEEWIGV
jgi:MSHA biogenesis protein MshJ